MRMTTTLRAAKRTPLLQVAKSAIATLAAWFIAGWVIPGPLPVFAAIAALLVVQPSLNQSFVRAFERTVGVIVGVIVASALGIAFGDATWVIAAAVVVALVLAWAIRMTPGSSSQVAITALLVLALGAATPGYALHRIVETLMGAVIGFIVNVIVVPPISIEPAHRTVAGLGIELAATLERLAAALGAPQTPEQLTALLVEARLLRPMKDAADTAIAAAEESLTFNPRAKRHRQELADLRGSLEMYSPIVTQVIGMTRTFCDRYDASLESEPAVHAIAEQLRRAAHDIRLSASSDGADGAAPPASTVEPALTTPLIVAAPSAAHWILIGSLLVDLRRIHEAVGDAG